MMKEAIVDFGSYVKSKRIEKGWTIEALAEKAGLSTSYLWRVEQHRRFPTLECQLQILAFGFEVDRKELEDFILEFIPEYKDRYRA